MSCQLLFRLFCIPNGAFLKWIQTSFGNALIIPCMLRASHILAGKLSLHSCLETIAQPDIYGDRRG